MSEQRTSGAAITSLVCGILGFFTIGIAGLLGVIFGHVALSRIKASAGQLGGKGLAIAGLVTGYLSLLLFPLAIFGMTFVAKKATENAKVIRVMSDMKSLESELGIYKLNTGQYPTQQQGLAALVERPVDGPSPSRWTKVMNKIPEDPWGNPYGYRPPSTGTGSEPEILSKGPDGLEGTSDDLSSKTE